MQAVQDGHEAVRLPTGREVADRWGTEGNVEFYDKVVAGTMLKLVRRYDKNAKVEQVEAASEHNKTVVTPPENLKPALEDKIGSARQLNAQGEPLISLIYFQISNMQSLITATWILMLL
jgi:hypothetical protein